MSDDMINIIGIACLGALFWYTNIHRPKRKLKDPGELQVKSVMNEDDRVIDAAVKTLFAAPYVIKNNVTMDDLVYSAAFDKKPFFRRAMRQRKIGWLILDKNYAPVLAVDIATGDDDVKLNCLASAGIPCCIFEYGTPATEITTELTQASEAISLPLSDSVVTEPTPEAA